MDQAKEILENSVNRTMLTNVISSTDSEPKSTEVPESYLKRVVLIVNDSYELSSSDPTLAQKMRRAEVWAQHCFQIIPEDYLQPSFERAFKNHETDFNINAYSL